MTCEQNRGNYKNPRSFAWFLTDTNLLTKVFYTINTILYTITYQIQYCDQKFKKIKLLFLSTDLTMRNFNSHVVFQRESNSSENNILLSNNKGCYCSMETFLKKKPSNSRVLRTV